MDRLKELEYFIAVVDESSFAGAARRLKVSPPAITRAVAALEERLGTRLLNRTTRQVKTTDMGASFAAQAKQLVEDYADLSSSVTTANQEPAGQLVVSAPTLFGRYYVMPVITRYLDEFPAVDISTYFVDRIVNFVEEGIDVGIRIGDLPDSSLQATTLGKVSFRLCAAPSYLDAAGKPTNPADLAAHTIISSRAGDFSVNWQFRSDQRVNLNPRLTVSSNDAALEAARAGFGITRLLSYQVEPMIRSGELVPLLTEFEPEGVPVNIIHREGRYPSARNRLFVDRLKDQITLPA